VLTVKCSMPSTPMDFCEKGKYQALCKSWSLTTGMSPLTVSALSHMHSLSVKGITSPVVIMS